MISRGALQQINELLDNHCANCAAFNQLKNEKHHHAVNFCLKNCWVAKKIQKIAAVPKRRARTFTNEERFYLVNHIDVLGRDRGVQQVAKRLGVSEYDIEFAYDEIKAKTRQHAS